MKNASRETMDPDDRFEEATGPLSAEARSQCATLQTMATKLERLDLEISKFYVFDKQK